MKLITLLAVIFLCSCGGATNQGSTEGIKPVEKIQEASKSWLIAGQSNAVRCDWDYIGDEYESIAVGSQSIQDLIDIYPDVDSSQYDGILFVHGEQDAYLLTDPAEYIQKVEEYRKMIGLPIYISTVGYDLRYPGNHDEIRQAVIDEAEVNPSWTVTFNDAQLFPELGYLLPDGVHFNQQGCEMMMDFIRP